MGLRQGKADQALILLIQGIIQIVLNHYPQRI